MPPVQVPFLERFEQILGSEHATWLILLLVLGATGAFLLVFFRAYRPLLALMIIGQTFSLGGGATQGVLTLLRFGTIFALFPLGVRGLGKTGFSQRLLIGYAAYMLVLSPFSLNFSWSVQRAIGLLLLYVAVSGATAAYVTNMSRALKAVGIVALMAFIWVGVSLVFGTTGGAARSTGQGKFVGVAGEEQSVAVVGSIMAPFLLWGVFYAGKRLYRYAAAAGVFVLIPMLLLTGQRVGLFGAIVGMLPLLVFRLGSRRVLAAGLVTVVTVIASLQLLRMIDAETQHIIMRKFVYDVTDTTGRTARWAHAFRACAQSPLLGHGAGMCEQLSAQTFGGGVHNAFLVLWYDGGIISVFLWFAAIGYCSIKSVRLLMMRGLSSEAKEILRAVFGCFMTIVAVGFFEGKLMSPTNFTIGMFIFSISMIERLIALSRNVPGRVLAGAPDVGPMPAPSPTPSAPQAAPQVRAP